MPLSLERLIRRSSVLVAPWLFVVAIVLAGCDSPTAPPDAGSPDAGHEACAAGELTRDDGTCQPAGLPPDMPCPPGELLQGDGVTCQKAGVPPSACGAGFMPDGKDGCEPILPADTCTEGLMAIPGDTVCHEVAPCGSGAWGDIPIDANTQFVDQAYAGGNSDGTQTHPWLTIQQGVNNAAAGDIVAVAAGSYAEDVMIQSKAVRLWGRCPAMVEVAGTGAELGAITVLTKAANGAEIHGVAITGAKVGIAVSGANDLLIEAVRIHDTAEVGLNVQNDLGLTSVVLKGSLVEQTHDVGVQIVASEATIEATVVRATQPTAMEKYGRGIRIQNYPNKTKRANAAVRGCLIEQNHSEGIDVIASDATIEATVIRSTLPATAGKEAFGIFIHDDHEVNVRATATVRACLVEQSQESGVHISGSDVTIEATVVRSTAPNGLGTGGDGISIQDRTETKERANVIIRASRIEQNQGGGVVVFGSDVTLESTVVSSNQPNAMGELGRGIEIDYDPDTQERANVTVRACVLDQNHDIGMLIAASDVTIEATAIRSTLPNAVAQSGRGISIQDDPDAKERANVTVRACLIEQNDSIGVFVRTSDAAIEATEVRDALGSWGRGISIQGGLEPNLRANVAVRACLIEQSNDIGVYVSGSDATIEGTVVRSTQPDALGESGRGMNIQSDRETDERANVTVRACLVEKNSDMGVFIGVSDVTIVDSIVRDTTPRGDGTFGDGMSIFGGNVTIQDVDVTQNARAGVASFGGQVVITGGVLACNGFDLEGEPIDDIPFSFDGSTGWRCSDKAPAVCTELGGCHVETTGISAPSELPPADPVMPQ